MKFSRKQPHCLFVEEEQYNWAPTKCGISGKLIGLSALFILAALLFSVLR